MPSLSLFLHGSTSDVRRRAACVDRSDYGEGSWYYADCSGSVDFQFTLAPQGEELLCQSRWMFISRKWRMAINWLSMYYRQTASTESAVSQYNAPDCFGITSVSFTVSVPRRALQVLLIAAVAAQPTPGNSRLLSFILGLLISNTLVAILTSAGFTNSARLSSPCYLLQCRHRSIQPGYRSHLRQRQRQHLPTSAATNVAPRRESRSRLAPRMRLRMSSHCVTDYIRRAN